MISIGSDHRGYKLKEEIKKYLGEVGISYTDYGTENAERAEYPDIAKKVAISIQKKQSNLGILICGTGFGMTITANKFKGIRCVPCYNEYTAKHAKLHNNANILALGAEHAKTSEIIAILRIWLATEFEGERHQHRLELIEEIEKENMR